MKSEIGIRILLLSVFVACNAAKAQDVFDSDLDGIDDNTDNCTLAANVSQRDTDEDGKGNMCDPDFNNDGIINFEDFNIMSARFFTDDKDTDLEGDGITNFVDLMILSEMFFLEPGPTGADPSQPPCNCYFSSDCNDGDPTTNLFCDYGPGSFTTEDICAWRDIKPNGQFGAGCSIESDLTTGAWTPDICDGVCVSNSRGSIVGSENHALVAENINLWGDAMINPSAAGGGPVDESIATEAMAVQFNAAGMPLVLGRQTADALAMAAGEPFHDYFCHWEGHPDDPTQPIVDLSDDACRVTSAQLTIQALTSEIQTPGTAAAIMQAIPDACPNWQQMFGTQCQPGPDALNCAIQFIQAQAYFLRTPLVAPASAPSLLEKLTSQR